MPCLQVPSHWYLSTAGINYFSLFYYFFKPRVFLDGPGRNITNIVGNTEWGCDGCSVGLWGYGGCSVGLWGCGGSSVGLWGCGGCSVGFRPVCVCKEHCAYEI